MDRICEFFVLMLIVLFLICIISKQEFFVNQYGINSNYKPYDSAVLHTTSPSNIVYDPNQYPSTVSYNPWYKPWKNGRNRFYCYLDNHLQRRCFWDCEDKENCQAIQQKCC